MLKTNAVLSTGDVARFLGVSGPTINRYVKSGLLTPIKKSRGTGDHNAYSSSDALALGLLFDLVRRGVTREAASMVADYVRTADLELSFASGKTLMVIYGKYAYRQLLRPDDLAHTLKQYALENSDFEWDQCKIVDLAGACGEVNRMLATVNGSEAEHTTDSHKEVARVS